MARPWRPTKEQIAACYGKRVSDLIRVNLKVLFVGINPSLYSAAVRHHFGRPGNRFWPTLHAAGFTDRLLSPFEEDELLAAGYGISNIVSRATATADELSRDELLAGAIQLQRKVRRYRPAVVAFLGISAYRTAFEQAKAKIGPQTDKIADAEVWILPNPSGLNAHYQLADLAKLYGELRRHVDSAGTSGS